MRMPWNSIQRRRSNDSIGYYSNAGLTAALGGTAKNILRDTIPTDGNVDVYAKLYIKDDASFNSYDAQTIVGTFRSRSTRDVAADSGIIIAGPITIPIGTGLQNATSQRERQHDHDDHTVHLAYRHCNSSMRPTVRARRHVKLQYRV